MKNYTLKPAQPTQNDALTLQSIDESLSLLGEASKSAIYYHLEHSCGMKKTDILSRSEEFYAFLESVFGSAAAPLQKVLFKKPHQKTRHSHRAVQLSKFIAVNSAFTQNVVA
jgi:hypothetical protein